MKYVIEAVVLTGGLDPDDIVRLFHHADDMLIAVRIGALLANFGIADIAAKLA